MIGFRPIIHLLLTWQTECSQRLARPDLLKSIRACSVNPSASFLVAPVVNIAALRRAGVNRGTATNSRRSAIPFFIKVKKTHTLLR
jgi:hypothetical protein